MSNRFSGVIVTAAIAAAGSAAIPVSITQNLCSSAGGFRHNPGRPPPTKTVWGEPDLQGIWTNEFDTPLQRPAKFGNQEFFTKRNAELDQARLGILNRRATQRDANNGYNGAAWQSYANSATIVLSVEGANDLVAAVAISDASNVWDAGLHGSKVDNWAIPPPAVHFAQKTVERCSSFDVNASWEACSGGKFR